MGTDVVGQARLRVVEAARLAAEHPDDEGLARTLAEVRADYDALRRGDTLTGSS